jgi:hypothetical protein
MPVRCWDPLQASPLFWDVKACGDWNADCKVGADFGRIYLECARPGQPCPATVVNWARHDRRRTLDRYRMRFMQTMSNTAVEAGGALGGLI